MSLTLSFYYTSPTLGHIHAFPAELVNERSALAMF